MKKIIISFDGTGNEAADAEQKRSLLSFGEPEDNSITNVLKLHLLLGGNLKDEHVFDEQPCFYYSGVGTYGKKFKRAFNAGLGLQNLDINRIQDNARRDLLNVYRPGDEIYLFGFSRGAAIARQFASRVIPEAITDSPNPVHFMGVFDTVASIGIPNLDKNDRPMSDVVFEDMTIARSIKSALHLVALDERRKAFLPTLMNDEERVTEVWFSGVHSDIGGGFRKDGLSDITLNFMLDYIRDKNLGLKIREPKEIDYRSLLPAEAEFKIDYSDVMMNPNPFGPCHQQQRLLLASLATLCDRTPQVIYNDEPLDKLPLVHHTVAERIYGDPDYKPQSLVHVGHQVLMPNGERHEFDGLQEHRMSGRKPLRVLQTGIPHKVRVYAGRLYNHSGVLLKTDQSYSFQVNDTQRWYDSTIPATVRGWDVDDTDVQLGWVKETLIRTKEDNRRIADAKWFELCAAVGESEQELFQVLHYLDDLQPFTPNSDGEFCPFANDLLNRYGNNMGFLDITIKRID